MTIDGAVGAHDQPVGAKAPRKPLYRGRRFAQSFCTFQAVAHGKTENSANLAIKIKDIKIDIVWIKISAQP